MVKGEQDPLTRLNETKVKDLEIDKENIFEIVDDLSKRFSFSASVDRDLIRFYSASSTNRFVQENLLSERSFFFSESNVYSILRDISKTFGLGISNIAFNKKGEITLIPLGWGDFFGYLNEDIFVEDVLKKSNLGSTTIERALLIFELRAKYGLYDLELIGFDSFDEKILKMEITVEAGSNTIDHLLREIARITDSKILYTGSELILVNRGERE